jgi:hypothetical protein
MSIKSRLVKWLLPEIKTELKQEIESKMLDMMRRKLMSDIAIRERQSIVLLQNSRTILEDQKRTIDGEMNALYFTFEGRKRVSVKTILVKLMEYLDIQMATRQSEPDNDIEVYLFKYKK